jgi:hypothetical protein
MVLHVVNSGPIVQESHCNVPLEDLARQIRANLKAVQVAASNALDAALSAGDNLIAAQARVPDGRWNCWLRENCSIAGSTAALYMQLARARPEIEAEISRAGELSIRAARKLIAKKSTEDEVSEDAETAPEPEIAPEPKPEPRPEPKSEKPDPATTVAAVLTETPAAAVTAALATKDVDWFLRVMPAAWCPELTARVINLPGACTAPLLKASETLRRALSLVKIADAPMTTPAVAASNEKEALAVLRTLNVLLTNVPTDCITIVNKHAKEKRCAKGRAKGRCRAA